MTDERLKEIQERLDKATPGVWEVYNANEGTDYGPMWCIANDAFHNPPADDNEPWLAVEVHTGRKCDADFIAHAISDIPFLLAEIERLKSYEPCDPCKRDDHDNCTGDCSSQCCAEFEATAIIERQAKVIAEARNLVGALASLAAVAHAAGLYEAYEAHGIAAQRLRAILEGEP